MIKYKVNIETVHKDGDRVVGVVCWSEYFDTIEDAQARIDVINAEGLNTTADTNIEEFIESAE